MVNRVNIGMHLLPDELHSILKNCTGCTFPQLNDGDLMSNLMEMESGRVFNSQKESLGSILREGARVSAKKQTSRNVKDKGRSSE